MNLVSFARVLRVVVFASLMTSAAVAIVLSERLWRLWGNGELPSWAPLGAPACFATFMGFFLLDRLVAVRREQEAPARAFLQVGAAVLLFTLLLPQHALQMHREDGEMALIDAQGAEPRDPLAPLELLLQHDDDAVREATCLLLSGEPLAMPHPAPPGHPLQSLRAVLLELAENDAALGVRNACATALGHLGPVEEDDALPNLVELDTPGGPEEELPPPDGRIESL